VTCLGSTATAQSVVTGAIFGTLTDAGKEAIATANVVARNVDTKRETTATSDDEGRFRILGLQPGHYIIEVAGPGFTSAVVNAVVEVGRATTMDISLTSHPALSGLAPTRLSGINSTRQGLSVNLNQTSFNDSQQRPPLVQLRNPGARDHPGWPFRRGQFSRHQQLV
jgi:hypothetical protein